MATRPLVTRLIDDYVVVDEDEDSQDVYELCIDLKADLVLVSAQFEDGSSGLCAAPPIALRNKRKVTVGDLIGSRQYEVDMFDSRAAVPMSHEGTYVVVEHSLGGGSEWAEVHEVGVVAEAPMGVHDPDDDSLALVVSAQAPRDVRPNEVFDIEVSLDNSAWDGTESAPVDAAPDEILRCRLSTMRAGRVIEGSAKNLQFDRSSEPSSCTFRVEAPDAGTMVWAVRLYRQDGTLAADLRSTAEVSEKTNLLSFSFEQRTSLLPVEASDSAVVGTRLVVTVQDTGEGNTLCFEASEGECLHELGEQNIGAHPAAGISEIFQDLGLLPEGVAGADIRDYEIEQLSEAVWRNFLSEGAQEFLFERANPEKPTTLLIESNEPWIPWEMASVTTNLDDGTAVTKGHLCDVFDLAREADRASRSFAVERIGWVCVKDSGLAAALTDRQAIEGGTGEPPAPEVEDIRAEPIALRHALSSGRFDVLHFVGHGVTQVGREVGAQVLTLNGGERFSSLAIVSKVIEGLTASQPFVFLNTCHAGAQKLEFGKIGGWAEKFMDGGAGGFLGCHWAVNDGLAAKFAEVFYAEIGCGSTVALAVRKARAAIRTSGDPTWLAYTLHGNPNATFNFAEPVAD